MKKPIKSTIKGVCRSQGYWESVYLFLHDREEGGHLNSHLLDFPFLIDLTLDVPRRDDLSGGLLLFLDGTSAAARCELFRSDIDSGRFGAGKGRKVIPQMAEKKDASEENQ